MKEIIEGKFHLPLSVLLPSGIELFPLDNEDPDKALLFGSAAAKERVYLVQADIPKFLNSASEGYYAVFFWGHGGNSYAFYYQKVLPQLRIFLRLGYGGIYMNNDLQAKLIHKFMVHFLDFEKRMEKEADSFIAVEAMWHGDYRIKLKNGDVYRYETSLFENPDFNLIFREEKK